MPLPLSIKATGQFPIVVDLPPEIAFGIGQVLSAHALIEHSVQHLLYDLMVAHAHVGRIAIVRRDPAVHFESIKSLASAWGIKIEGNALQNEIRDHTKQRNYLAHGVWVALPPAGVIALSKTTGYYETEEGKRDAEVAPEPFVPPSGYFASLRSSVLATASKVDELRQTVAPSLPPLPDISRWA